MHVRTDTSLTIFNATNLVAILTQIKYKKHQFLQAHLTPEPSKLLHVPVLCSAG